MVVTPPSLEEIGAGPETMVRRFSLWARLTHAALALSVFGLVLTGMPLKYSNAFWAWPLMRLWGGPHMAGRIHRAFALMFFASGAMHVAGLVVAAVGGRFPPVKGPDTILPRREDATQLVQNLRFLRGWGPRPEFGKFAYWEKFDYFAEIWGLLVIGLSGLVMWFPDIAARYLPGWVVNAALIFHSYEALLAMGFLFTIHFFNTHLRPDVFPVDRVMFSGTISAGEVRHRYPGWYARLSPADLTPRASGGRWSGRGAAIVSATFLTLGLVMLALVMSAAIAETIGYLSGRLP